MVMVSDTLYVVFIVSRQYTPHNLNYFFFNFA